MLQLRYGSYLHDLGECGVTFSKEYRYTDRGVIRSQVETWSITGKLHADTPAELTTAINALQAAYNRPGQDAVILLDGGTESAHKITSSQTLGGTKVTRLSFPDFNGGEYATFRSYQIELEAEYEVNRDSQNVLVTYEETVTATSGGERWIIMPTLTGPGQRQTVQQQSPYKFSQVGRAIGLGGYPMWPGPMFPADEHIDQRQISLKSPTVNGNQQREYEVTWSYQFESISNLSGFPSVGN